MERYAPTMKDLASRDVVSRAMATEIKEGRGAGRARRLRPAQARPPRPRRHRQAPAGHPRDRDEVRQRGPGEGADPGGADGALPDGRHPDQLPRRGGRARGRQPDSVVPGFYAAGECGCASIHGANRLGTNSLTDLLVMGKSSALSMIEFIRERRAPTHRELPKDAGDYSLRARGARSTRKTGGEERARGARRDPAHDAGALRRLPLPRPARRRAWRRSRRSPSARSAPRISDKSQGLQHRAHRGARAREPRRGGARHDDLGRGAQGKPRRPRPRRLPPSATT